MSRILMLLQSDRKTYVELLTCIGRHNARLMRVRPDVPDVYSAGVVYTPDPPGYDLWVDAPGAIVQHREDCDSLSSWGMGGILARGVDAMHPWMQGYALAVWARSKGRTRIPAQVMLTTRARPGEPGLSHAIVRYRIEGKWYEDDPSARLGMRTHDLGDDQVARVITPEVVDLWDRLGITDRIVQRWAERGVPLSLEQR